MHISNEMLSQTLALPPAEWAALAHQLLLSLDPPDFDDAPSDWEQEFAARLDAVEEGNYSARTWREAFADMRQTLEKGRRGFPSSQSSSSLTSVEKNLPQ